MFLTAPSASEMDHWEPTTTDSQPWIQVDLMVPHDITGIVLRGTSTKYVSTFTLSYGLTGEELTGLTNLGCISSVCSSSSVQVCVRLKSFFYDIYGQNDGTLKKYE
jgi:hypothetical protein